MKTAIYLKEGRTQVVLTPESDFERMVMEKFGKGVPALHVYHGEFYNCMGGWTRQGPGEDSLIIVLDEAKE